MSQFSALLAAPFVFATEKANWLMIHLVDPFSGVGLASFRLPHYHGEAGAIFGFLQLVLRPVETGEHSSGLLVRVGVGPGPPGG